MFLIVDIESSGLLMKDRPLSDPQQPWIVSCAAELVSAEGKTLDFFHRRVKADGRKIKDDAAKVHGISSRQAATFGASEIVVLGMLSSMVADARYVIGHGLKLFDKMVIEGVLIRRGKDARLFERPGLEFLDTMETATAFCKIEPKPAFESNQYKWPSLDEACQIILGEEPREGPHDAWEDCQRTKRLFFALKERNAFEIPEAA